MNLNADFSRRVAVHAERLPWTPSPVPGIERRMLDRMGEEVARATSFVRYAPRSLFSPHVHGGGEEFLVLEGVFEDEHGAFPAGTYIRNPPTSSHTPGSGPGCTIFVKLWQFDPGDRTEVRIDTARKAYVADPECAGVEQLPLFQDARERVRLERWAPGREITVTAPAGLELVVLEGGFSSLGEAFERHSWLRLPAGDVLRARVREDGCRLWIKSGHLAHPQAAPPVP